ncbi:type II toxin-antitoxin system RelE/ParE family toxin [Fortiea sp. LEGE XX443]|uniref:type II toxin-antitoxin system RelE/ParE family toxin n=1 Tax=Fortiea sp. LEGE XX443 TaxID=1828611 RepID=UPI001882F0E3|nr:type II toxin-antitoxin system RelE/ParE family toxin [Fortiea sp. LEGE XX443]MBE9007721.1 type II toxin-antitoxin system RelE/ParE family toxin [Fortiea sp. LEGE XX443]
MNYRLIVKDRATQDLRHLANYLLINRNADVAVKFLSAAEMTFAQLQKTPGIGKVTQLVVSRLGEIRQWRIKDFPDYLIFYSFQNATIEILRVFHGARDLADVLSELDEEF